MKILHIAEASFAGVGRHVIDITRAQAAAGHQVVAIYGTARESDRFRRARERTTNVRWIPVAVSRRPGGSDLRAVQMVRAVARGFAPDVVHGHATKGGMLARAVPSGPWTVVYTPHAVFSMNPLLGRGARTTVDVLERTMANRTDTVIAVSPEEETHLRMMGIEPAKIRMIPNGIPPIERADKQLVRRALGLPLDRPVIGFVGRIDGQKAPHALLNIFKEVAVARPNVDFVVVGDGPMREELRQRANISRCLRGRVHLVGEQPGPWAMAGMDVLALPSRYEGMPYVLIEAAHLGLPMVVTRAAGSALLQTGPSTILVNDVGDIRALANSCIELIDQWPDNMPVHPDRRFSLEGMAALTELAYRRQPLDLDGEPSRTVGGVASEMMSAAAASSAANGTGSLPVIRVDTSDDEQPQDGDRIHVPGEATNVYGEPDDDLFEAFLPTSGEVPVVDPTTLGVPVVPPMPDEVPPGQVIDVRETAATPEATFATQPAIEDFPEFPDEHEGAEGPATVTPIEVAARRRHLSAVPTMPEAPQAPEPPRAAGDEKRA